MKREPIDILATNPIQTATFKQLRVYTAQYIKESSIEQITEPYEDNYPKRTFIALYGVKADGTLEHIADRKNEAQMAWLLSGLYGIELVTVQSN